MLIELPALYIDEVISVVSSTRPLLINRNPGPDEENVPLTSHIELEIVDSGTAGVRRSATRVWVNEMLAFEGGVAPEIKSAFNGSGSGASQTSDILRIVLVPIVPFESLAVIIVRVVSSTMDGHTLDETYSFTVEDRTAPRLLGAQAIAPKILKVAFDEPIIVVNTAGFVLEPLAYPAVTPIPVEATVQDTIVELTFDTEMSPDLRYRLTVTGVTDLFDNSILPPYNTTEFTGFRPARPLNRRFDLWSMIPVWNRREDVTGDLWRFIACLQEVTDLLLAEVDRFPDIFDLERSPTPFLDLILLDLGNPFPFELTDIGKRRLASVLVEMYMQKGTAIGIENAVRFFLGVNITAITPLAGTCLILGESELGIDWILGPSDRFARYAFTVIVDVVLTDTQRKQLRAIVEYMKPAHTHFVDLIEPEEPIVYEHWELGFSELGTESDLH
jgi:phage tail-like protein